MGKHRHKKSAFKKQWGTLTELGQLFSVSAVKLGAQLKTMGLRHPNGNPTEDALALNLALSTPRAGGFAFYMWNLKLLPDLLKEAGWAQVAESSDPSFKVAQIVLALSKKAQRFHDEGQDKMATYAYEASRMEISDALNAASPSQKISLALRVADHLAKGGMETSDVHTLMNDCGVSQAQMDARRLAIALPQATIPAPPRRL